MIHDSFYLITQDSDVADILTAFLATLAICFIAVSPLFFTSFRNARFIDKMNKKQKKQGSSFDVQFSKLIGNAGKQDDISEYKKQLDELKAEIEQLKKKLS